MTEFTKTKIAFVMAMLGTLFTLHPLIERFGEFGYEYLGVRLRVFDVYLALAVLLGLAVYFYALVLSNERPHSWAERMGNTSYALALMVLPLYGGLYSANLLAERVGHSHLAWAAPIVAVSLGVVWLLISQLATLLLRNRLGKHDRTATVERLASNEINALTRAKELFTHEHYDLSVIEAWRALESRLSRVLLARGIRCRNSPQALLDAATRAGILCESALGLVDELRRHWNVAVSTVPLTKEAAESALAVTRGVLATISVLGADDCPVAVRRSRERAHAASGAEAEVARGLTKGEREGASTSDMRKSA